MKFEGKQMKLENILSKKIQTQKDKHLMMWDSPLYAVNMFYYHWLIKKLIWPMTGQNIARWKIQTKIYRESRWSQADAMWLLKEKDTRILPVNNESRGKM